jgi:RNA polymerase sigma-70 factor (ECF subfamily)
MLDDDAVIAQSWQQPERFAVLFDRHAAYIHRYITRRAGPQAAEDLVAETFLTAFRKRRRYQHGYASARPWLYGIATHLVGQHHRDQARQHRLYQAAGPAPVSPDFSERADARVTATAIRPVLTEALAGLPPGDRDVLLLIAWEELSYEEVARALGIPLGTVRSRLYRARVRLRKALAPTGAAATYKEIVTNE